MRTVTPLDSSPNYTRLQMWNNQLTDAPAAIKLGLEAAEALSAGSDQPWLYWRSLNRLCTGIGRVKITMRRLARLTTRSQSTEPSVHWDWPCKDNDEEVG